MVGGNLDGSHDGRITRSGGLAHCTLCVTGIHQCALGTALTAAYTCPHRNLCLLSVIASFAAQLSQVYLRETRCSGKFVAPENNSDMQQYGLRLRLRIGSGLKVRLKSGLGLGLRLGLGLGLGVVHK